MSDLKRGEALVIFLAVGFMLFMLTALAAVLCEFIRLQSSRLSKYRVDKLWKKRRLSLCNPETNTPQRSALEGTRASVHFPSNDLTIDGDVIVNNGATPSGVDETQ